MQALILLCAINFSGCLLDYLAMLKNPSVLSIPNYLCWMNSGDLILSLGGKLNDLI